MTSRVFALVAFIIGATVLPWPKADAETGEQRIALVIANSNYGDGLGMLPNPIKDGALIAESFKSVGFAVTLVTDADQKTMKRAIGEFGEQLAAAGGNGVGLFYYAGHGLQVGGINYLVPIGAALKREADADLEAVEAESVLKQMEFAGSRINIVILDACRNNPLARSVRSASRGLARMDAPTGSFIAYSTAPGEVASDGATDNSPFATALASEIAKPGLAIEEIFRHVRVSVKDATNGDQVPWDSSSLTDAFTFNGAPEEPAAATTTVASATPPGQAAAGDVVRQAGQRYEYRGPALMKLPRELRPASSVLDTLRNTAFFQTLPAPQPFTADLVYEYVDKTRQETARFESAPVLDGISRVTRKSSVQETWQGVANAHHSEVEETNIVAGPLTLSVVGEGSEESAGASTPVYYEGSVQAIDSATGDLFPINEGTHVDLSYAWQTQSGQQMAFKVSATTIGAMPCTEAHPGLSGTCYVVEARSSFEGNASEAFWTLLYPEDAAVFIPWGEFGADDVVQGKVAISGLGH
jgi:hypothetical protein